MYDPSKPAWETVDYSTCGNKAQHDRHYWGPSSTWWCPGVKEEPAMARREIEYGPYWLVWDGRAGKDVSIWPCLECGVGVLNKDIHTEHHNVGR